MEQYANSYMKYGWINRYVLLLRAPFFFMMVLHNADGAGQGEETKGDENWDVHAWLSEG